MPQTSSPHKPRLSTYKTLLYTLVSITFLGSVCALLVSSYLKDKTIRELAVTQAQQQSDIIFKSLWQGMMQGWSKQDMDHYIHSLELSTHKKQVHLIRSPIIEAQYGTLDASQQILAEDPILARVMQQGISHIEQTDGQLRYLYPIKATESCLSCHTNSHYGAIHGVIDLRFSDQPMQTSLSRAFNTFIAMTLATVVLLCGATFVTLRLKIVRPMRQISHQIRDAIKDDRTVNRIDPLQFQLKEPYLLAENFNLLAQELEDYHDQLKEESCTDALTGLFNRRYFTGKIPELLNDAKCSDSSLTAILIDLDRFKPINDTYGHDAGDMALTFFASVLQRNATPDDLVIRLGGDEFLVVQPHGDISDARHFKKKLIQSLNEKRANLGVVSLHLSASVGYACFPEDASSADELILKADQAMYREKQIRKAGSIIQRDSD